MCAPSRCSCISQDDDYAKEGWNGWAIGCERPPPRSSESGRRFFWVNIYYCKPNMLRIVLTGLN